MEPQDEREMYYMQRARIPADKPLDQLPIFSYQYYRRAVWFHWVTGLAAGMGIGLAQVRLWPHYAPAFVILQGLLLSFALFHVLREHKDMKKQQQQLRNEAKKWLEELNADLNRHHPDDPSGNAEKIAAIRKAMEL
jgi:hypothetical protein